MLGSGSAGNSALVATDHGRVLVDGGLSARQVVLRLEQCGIAPEQLDGVVLTHEHTDHICGLEVLCHKFDLPIYCNRLTAEALRSSGLVERCRNWRLFVTGAEFSICDMTVQTFPVPHDAVDPLGFVFSAGSGSLGFITDLGYVTKMIVERLRHVQTLVIETNHDEKTSAERHAPSLAGETAHPVSAWTFIEHGCGRRDRRIVTWKNRTCRAGTSQPGLQYAGTRVRRRACVAREMRQARRRSLLRDPI